MISIGDRQIGAGHPCFVIAEAGVNHNGDINLARELIDVAKACGADAVKFQTYTASRLASLRAPKAAYQSANGVTESQLEMLTRLQLSEADHRELLAYCDEAGITFLSSPFDEESTALLRSLNAPLLKIPSGELTNHPYLADAASTGIPLVMSTGMSSLEEVAAAMRVVRESGGEDVVLLHCVSNYPADPEGVNLRAMQTLRAAFGVPVGYSDHVPNNAVAYAAVALGACVVEKHFTLDRGLPGPDHKASLEPDELRALVTGIRAVESALGDGIKAPAQQELSTRDVARKSLVAARDLSAGHVLSAKDLVRKRPGTGLAPSAAHWVVGRRLLRDLEIDSVISRSDLE